MPAPYRNWTGYDEVAKAFLNSQKRHTQAVYKSVFKLALQYPDWDDTRPNTVLSASEILELKRLDKTFNFERKMSTFREWVKQQPTRKGHKENDCYGDHQANSAVTCLRSFFDYYREPLKFNQNEKRKLNAKSKRKTSDYRLENEDITKLVYVADLMEKYVVLFGKSVGLRVGDFVTFTYGTFRSINLEQPAPIFIGEMVTQKEGVPAYPFIDSDALPIIKKVLAVNKIKPDTERIITVKEEEMTALLQRLAARGGVVLGGKRLRFHCLRKYLIDRLANNMSESKWKQIVGKAISEDAYVSPFELRSCYLNTMKWTTINQDTAGLDMDKLNAVMELAPDIVEIAKLKREKKLLIIDDPDLIKKLKDAGVKFV